MVLEVPHLEGCQFPIATNVHRDFRHMGNRSHSAWFSVHKVNLARFFALIILITCLLQTSLSMKSSVVPESIMALIVTDSFSPCSYILSIIWSLSCSRVSVYLSAA